MADVTATTALRPLVIIDFTEPDELPFTYKPSPAEKSTSKWRLQGHRAEEEATAELANLLQDEVLDELFGPAWPACPGHPHPAQPKVVDGSAVWACPKAISIVARIGQLHAERRGDP